MSYGDSNCTCSAAYHCGCADHPNLNNAYLNSAEHLMYYADAEAAADRAEARRVAQTEKLQRQAERRAQYERDKPALPLPVWIASLGTGAIIGASSALLVPPAFGILIGAIGTWLALPLFSMVFSSQSESAQSAKTEPATNYKSVPAMPPSGAVKRIGKGRGYRLRLASVLAFPVIAKRTETTIEANEQREVA